MITELSVLIPLFNHDVRPLVSELYRQCEQLRLTFEVLLIDDGSRENYRALNRSLSSLPFVRYLELPANIGRAAIRNMLATEAAYNYLLMLDNDCLPADDKFISCYVQEAAGEEVVVGGVTYSTKPADQKYMLHWKYGQRAARPATVRQMEPYKHIFLSNVLLKKDLFLQYRLYESLKDYGHEDTVFALKLERQKVRIKHIQNPVMHLGLEPTDIFLTKTEQAVDNLVQLYASGERLEMLKLIKAYRDLEERGVAGSFVKAFKLLRRLVLFNLSSARPGMLFFDLYRLFLFTGKMLERK